MEKIEINTKGWIKRKIKVRKMPITEIKIENHKSFLPTDWRNRLLK
jgi:hypothetical protein